tara:strand:+ start:385 stop:564 length:180 start_codon:yes stop_codon:yes gene_type:complete
MVSENKDITNRIEETLLKFKTAHVYNINLETYKLLEDAKEEILELRKRLALEEKLDGQN